MKCHHAFFITAATTIALGAFNTLASAQTPAVTTAPADTALPSVTVIVSDIKIGQFADAYVKIQTLKKEVDAKQSVSADPATAAALQSKMAEAVQQSGLDITKFNQIAQAMVSDTGLRTKVLAQVQQRMQAGG